MLRADSWFGTRGEDVEIVSRASGWICPTDADLPRQLYPAGGQSAPAYEYSNRPSRLRPRSASPRPPGEAIGHSKDTPLSTGAGAYVYWVLKSLGNEELAILRGGFEAWEASGGEMAAKPAEPRPYDVVLAFLSEWRATAQDVMSVVVGKDPGILLDARPHHMFNKVNDAGEIIASAIPNALNRPASPLMSALAGEFEIADGVDTVIEQYRSKGAVGHEGDVITFCKSGQLSALNWFYASELASIDNVLLYPELMIGWEQIYGVFCIGKS